ncbi:MAG: winged helix-turn-helix transcriptional regulator [Candidatus Heimdallarchaeota archaeon]|nr:MAG: winged helix-turn-helix transcriptional regulator [Candidatus Heimdallarchaeota archaeon]
MDELDKRILVTLFRNCRTAYRVIAQHNGVSTNTIKKRVEKLRDMGVIADFIIDLSLEMVDGERSYVFITTDGTEEEESFIQQIGLTPSVRYIAQISGGAYLIFATYTDGSRGLSKIGAYLRGLSVVQKVEIHPLLESRGTKTELTITQLMVLRQLAEDPRMPICEISRRTGLTSRTVRRVVNDFVNGDSVELTIRWNLNGWDSIAFLVQIHWDEKMMDPKIMHEMIQKQFPVEYWRLVSFASAISPTLFAVFVVNDVKSLDQITKEIRKMPHITSVVTIMGKPVQSYPDIKTCQLQKLLTKVD